MKGFRHWIHVPDEHVLMYKSSKLKDQTISN